nr:MAG TPA: hypothetical protein [Caudoviricetes sp.]
MPREYNIAWTDSQRKRLNSAVRRYNNAIRKAVKTNPSAAEFLPPEVKYQEVKSNITTSRALNNTVNRLNRITKPRALELVRQQDASIVTRYERGEYSILRSVRERAKSMRAKKLGIQQPKGRMGSLEQAKLSPDKRPVSSLSSNAIKRFLKNMEREMNMSRKDKARRYYSNYMRAMRNVFGGFEDYDNVIDTIENVILEMAEKDLDKLFKSIDGAPDIEYIYEPQAREDKLKRIYEYWTGYYD